MSFPLDEAAISYVVCTVPHREDYSEGEVESLFFSRQEYQTSRSSAKVVSRESEKFGFSKYLIETFSEKAPDVQDKLNAWAVNGHCRRGLERWANPDHGEKRQQEQFHAIMAVLRAQDEMLARKREIDWEKLRKVSHKATKKSRHFARMMGKADSYAIAQELRLEQGDDAVSLGDRLCALTVASEDATGGETTAASAMDDSGSLLGGVDSHTSNMSRDDSMKDSHHDKLRIRRFGFGRKNREKEARVSRVA